MLREALGGRRIAITGATGFLGTALVERALRCLPGTEVALIVRPGRRGAKDRVERDVLRNDCFSRLRRELGPAFDGTVSRRIIPVAGDVTQDGLGLDEEGREVLAGCTTVVHSAATVSFDSPLDAAVEVNLLGPSRVARALNDLHAGRTKPHLVAVSTAYVAGSRRGPAPEAPLAETPFSTRVPWRAEVEAARRARSDAEAASRSPERLAALRARARAELGAAGSPLLAEKTEKLRQEWTDDRMVELGKARAHALGWPDAYAYSKALGEWALLEVREDLPVTLVRPSIIEAALAEPHPGWIRGFRMADPVIISYAKGLLKEFPGIPEGVIDVIPVDLVVAAILAVAARGPLEAPDVVHAASGARNPLRYGELVGLVRDWFSEHPLADDKGQPIEVPEWSFPGRRRVQRQLRQATRLLEGAERALHALPLRGDRAEVAARVEERRDEAERALGYVELYGAYTETEARYRVDRLLELWDRTGEEDRARFCFDPAVIDWDHYVHDVHLPSVVEHARLRTTAGRSVVDKRPERSRRAILSPERHLAVFDLEHTLIASNVVDTYAWLASRHLSALERTSFVAGLLREAPSLLALDRRDRGDFLRSFYRRYEDAPVAQLAEDSWELFHRHLLTRSFPDGLARVREHRRLGHRTLLITGALDFVIAPLRPLFDDIVCASLGQRDGRYTGRLEELPPIGEARALLLADYAAAHDLALEESVAYADSSSDLAMLEAVGFPVAVNPEARLAAIARRRGWHVEDWSKASGGSHAPLPLGPFDLRRPGGRRRARTGQIPTASRVDR